MLDLLSEEQIMSEYVLGDIIRYNNRCRLKDESVAEHTCFVSIFCLKILAKLGLDHETERKVLILAALHDAAESRTSDIPHDVKANYPEMRKILDKVEKDYYKEEWSDYYREVYAPSDLCHSILKLADSYSVYQYCLNEMALGNISNDIKMIKSESYKRILAYTQDINDLMIKSFFEEEN